MSLASRSPWFAWALAVAYALVVGCGSDDTTNDGGAVPLAGSDAGATNADGGSGTQPPDPAKDGGVTEGAPDAATPAALPPGSKCVVAAGKMVSTSCQDNPALPTCFQCVDLTDNGEVDGVCAYTCRMGKTDCPQGQTCTAANVSQRTSLQPCRDATNGQELGYCQ